MEDAEISRKTLADETRVNFDFIIDVEEYETTKVKGRKSDVDKSACLSNLLDHLSVYSKKSREEKYNSLISGHSTLKGNL